MQQIAKIAIPVMLIIIGGMSVFLCLNQTPDAAAIATEQHQTERTRIETAAAARIAELSAQSERERNQFLLTQMMVAGLINREPDQAGLYLLVGIVGGFCFVGLIVVLFIAWKAEHAPQIEYRPAPAKTQTCHTCSAMIQMLDDEENGIILINPKKGRARV